MILSGHSAGGHLVAMIALSEELNGSARKLIRGIHSRYLNILSICDNHYGLLSRARCCQSITVQGYHCCTVLQRNLVQCNLSFKISIKLLQIA